MSQVVDLSTLRNRKSSETVKYEDLSEEDQEALDQMAEGVEPPKTPVLTAFTVIIDLNGQPQVVPVAEGSLVAVQREVTPNDIIGALSVIQNDILSQQAAQHTIIQLQMAQQQAMQQMQAQQIAQQLGGNLRGPNK